MYRGVVQLNSSQASLVFNLGVAELKDPLLRQKLTGVIEGENRSQLVNLSRDEVERLLDLLPPPTMGEAEELRSVRHKLEQFLSKSSANA